MKKNPPPGEPGKKVVPKGGRPVAGGRGTGQNLLPTDEHGELIPGTYDTSVGQVKVKKIERAKHYDVISMARAMNDDFGTKVKELFDPETEACKEAMATGLYVSWRPIDPPWDKQDCQRVNSMSRCFCSHLLNQHEGFTGREIVLKCKQPDCKCKVFNFIPSRPEESGEFWMRKRRDFDPATYRPRCLCKHTHEEHEPHPPPHRCRQKGCGCSSFNSNFVCAACDQHWHRHHTVLETEKERKQAGRPVGQDWLPFAELPDLCTLAVTGHDTGFETLADALPRGARGRGQLPPSDNNSPFRPPGGAAGGGGPPRGGRPF